MVHGDLCLAHGSACCRDHGIQAFASWVVAPDTTVTVGVPDPLVGTEMSEFVLDLDPGVGISAAQARLDHLGKGVRRVVLGERSVEGIPELIRKVPIGRWERPDDNLPFVTTGRHGVARVSGRTRLVNCAARAMQANRNRK
jgi:hypothetical protein